MVFKFPGLSTWQWMKITSIRRLFTITDREGGLGVFVFTLQAH
jgi:hypothetical protein